MRRGVFNLSDAAVQSGAPHSVGAFLRLLSPKFVPDEVFAGDSRFWVACITATKKRLE